jgi:hypothetical protein
MSPPCLPHRRRPGRRRAQAAYESSPVGFGAGTTGAGQRDHPESGESNAAEDAGNYFHAVADSAVHSRMGAQFLVRNNVFRAGGRFGEALSRTGRRRSE